MRLLIAGGGTGGHLFPGIAIAEELRARDAEAPILFVGTERGIEARVLPELGWDHHFIEVSGLKTVGIMGAMKGFLRLPRALWQARKVVKKFRPDVVVGVGGYASGPVVLMARLMGKRTAVLEQNSLPGLTNKILGKVVHAVFLCFDESRRFFRAKKILMTGNPIRRDIRLALESGEPDEGGEPGPLRVFVVGGSQGAVRVNELVADAAGLLAERGIAVSWVHQTGAKNLDDTAARYRQAGAKADLRPFIADMAAEYRRAQLVISRAGATTVAELGVVGRPAILIPYPFAADNHQEVNAREMAEAGAAAMVRQDELTGELLADRVAELARDRNKLGSMAETMRSLGKPAAAGDILDWCQSSGKKPGKSAE